MDLGEDGADFVGDGLLGGEVLGAGPDGLLKQLTKTVLETALDEELVDHLGYDKHDPAEV